MKGIELISAVISELFKRLKTYLKFVLFLNV